jgi:hypothetical protein
MRHCTPDELIDVVDGARSEASLPHLATCAACRQQLIELGAVLAEVAAVAVPEPTPVQWAALSSRVRDAVASEGDGSPATGWLSRVGWAWLVPVAAAAVLTIAVVIPREHKSEPGVASSAAVAAATAGAESNAAVVVQGPADDARADASLGLMFDLAGVVDLDSDPAPVLAMAAGTLDEAVGDLSPDEQHELARLINEAIERPGA